MSITEINTAINCVVEKTSPKEGYDLFCEVFEDSLRYIFSGKETNEQFRQIKDDEIYEMIKSICLAHANMLYARVLLNKHMPVLPEKEDKKEEKKDKKDKKEDKKEKNKQ